MLSVGLDFTCLTHDELPSAHHCGLGSTSRAAISVTRTHRVLQSNLLTSDALQAGSAALRAACSKEKEEVQLLQAQVCPCSGLCLLARHLLLNDPTTTDASTLLLVSSAAESSECAVVCGRHKALWKTRAYPKEPLLPMSKRLQPFTGIGSHAKICCQLGIGCRNWPTQAQLGPDPHGHILESKLPIRHGHLASVAVMLLVLLCVNKATSSEIHFPHDGISKGLHHLGC